MKKGLGILGVFLFLAGSAHAGERCYAPEQVAAEKVLRLHSEMMVTTVTCRYGERGEELSKLYAGFTQKNLPLFHDAEAIMIAYYENAYGGKGIDRLDELRTRLANEFGQEIARVSAHGFQTLSISRSILC